MLSLNKEHYWNLWTHVGSVLTRRLQLDVKAREAFLQVWKKGAGAYWDFLTLGCAEGSFGGRGLEFQGSEQKKHTWVQPRSVTPTSNRFHGAHWNKKWRSKIVIIDLRFYPFAVYAS